MLNIPEAVKALFKRDTVRKNVRLVWENGRPDIINTQLVSESLRFRESICSSDAIAFGTAEASTLEFETVGVENLFGLWFRAYIEVDASSLPADLQEVRPDLSFPVYSIPLGRFIVTACPRNHEALAHRKFSCRGRLSASKSLIPPAVLSTALSGLRGSFYDNEWKMRVSRDRLRAYLGIVPDSDLTLYSTKTQTEPGSNLYRYKVYQTSFQETLSSSARTRIYFAVQANAADLPAGAIMAECEGVPAAVTEADADANATVLASNMKDRYGSKIFKGITTTVPTLQEIEDEIRPILRDIYSDISRYGFRELDVYNYKNVKTPIVGSSSSTSGRIYLSPASITTDSGTRTPMVMCPVSIRIGGLTSGSRDFESWIDKAIPRNIIRVYTQADPTDSVLTDGVMGAQVRPGSGTYTVDLKEPLNQAVAMLTGALESFGGFFTMDRYGQPVMRTLSLDPVERVRPADYSSAWIEEQDLSMIGSIKYTMNGQEYLLAFGDGDSIYQLSNTEYWEKAGLSPDEVAADLQADLVPALAKLSYTPVDLEALGLPYMEAGDRIEVELEDGTLVQTYVLERNLEGIQHLTDSIIADGVTVQELESAELEEET